MTTIRHKSAARVTILVLMTASLAPLVACYTLVQHPRVATLGFRRPDPGKSCSSCHTSEEIRGYLRPEKFQNEPEPWNSLYHPRWLPPDSSGGRG